METKTIKERAPEYAWKKYPNPMFLQEWEECRRHYTSGAEEQRAIDIEKAIGWIRGHVDAVTWHGGKDDEAFIDAFRRALEE